MLANSQVTGGEMHVGMWYRYKILCVPVGEHKLVAVKDAPPIEYAAPVPGTRNMADFSVFQKRSKQYLCIET